MYEAIIGLALLVDAFVLMVLGFQLVGIGRDSFCLKQNSDLAGLWS